MDAITPPRPMDDEEERRRDKERRRLESERGRLEPSQRYRVMNDAIRQAQDLIELADKKVRFALVIISVLNGVLLFVAVQAGPGVLPRTGSWGHVVAVELIAYVMLTFFHLWQAISVLKPRLAPPSSAESLPREVRPAESARMLYHGDIAPREPATYRALWDELRQDSVNAELADQLLTLARINQAKYGAVSKLYAGVRLLVVILGALLLTMAAAAVL
jgi:Family of unknown function (DUF5706)